MEFFNLNSYKKLAQLIVEQREHKTNSIILSLPGAGISYYLKKFIERNKDVCYITSSEEPTSSFNILDLNFDSNIEAQEWCENYLKKSQPEQKFLIVINTPDIIESSNFNTSYLGRHIFNIFFFDFKDDEAIIEMAERLNITINEDHKNKITQLTGGIGRWTKYFLNHQEMIDMPILSILENDDLIRIITPTTEIIKRCSNELKEKLGVWENGGYKSTLLQEYSKLITSKQSFDIDIQPDLTLKELGENSGETLVPIEAEILKYILNNDGVIEKEKTADIKWGKGSYDNYSDQAINKTMRRLDKKLNKYKIKTIPSYGFKLTLREND
jgi:hypothetical protein